MSRAAAGPARPEGENPGRGRDHEYENNRRIAAQVARLLDAGAQIDDLRMLEILDLLKTRGGERGGHARQTHHRRRTLYLNDPIRHPSMLDLLAAHRIADYGSVRLSHATGLYRERLPVRLLLGTSPRAFDVVQAELLVLAAAHDRGGRDDAAEAARQWADLVNRMAVEAGEPGVELADVRSVQFERFDRRYHNIVTAIDRDDVRYVDGNLVMPPGPERDRQFMPFRFRCLTAQLAATADMEPAAGLIQLDQRQPHIGDKELLERTPEGKAALLERCFLVVETHHLIGKQHSALLSAAKKYIHRHLLHVTQVTFGRDGGHRHACLTWPPEDQQTFWLRAAAVRRHFKMGGPGREESSTLDGGERADLVELAPFVLHELTRGDDADPVLVNALSTRDALTDAWLMNPARQKAYLEVVEPLIARRRERYTATAAADTVVRNLLNLSNQLAHGGVDPDVWAQLIAQMDRVARQVQTQSEGGGS